MIKVNVRYMLASASFAASIVLGAAAAQAAELKEDIGVIGRLITVGDLFTDAGEKAEIAVLEAPAPGKSKSISSYDLERLAEQHGLSWKRPEYLKRISVRRLATTIQSDSLAELILEKAIDQGASPDSMVRFFGRNTGIIVPVDASILDVEFAQFSYSERQNRFNAILNVPSGTDTPSKMTLSGTIDEVRDIPVFNRGILPGETIASADINWVKFPAVKVNGRAILTSQQLVGKTVRRAARPGRPIMANDIMRPIAVDKGAAVTMTVRSGAMLLTASGRALENGSIGQTIRVINSKSRLTVDARVVSKGQVEILPAPSLALSGR